MQDSKGRTTGKCILKKESLSELSFRVFNGKDEEGSNRRSYGFSKSIRKPFMDHDDPCSRIVINRIREGNPKVRNVALLSIKRSRISTKISHKNLIRHFIANKSFKEDCYISSNSNEEEHHVNKDSIMSSRKSDETCMDTQELLRDHVFSAKPVLCESPADNVGCYQLEESTRMESKEFELEVSSNIQGTYNVTPQRVLLESYYNGAIQIFSTGYSSSLHPKNPIQNGEDVGQRKDPLLFLAIPFKKRVSHSINVLNIGDESTEKNI
ncbi:unnamed protein product [Lepeophtheirus salmonis]|uniref:(salmon louse) hypothetical protein n=1 Tax=Lepeophtheirus salmonis TaxID=72036 RepID=A0A7R8H1E5_LEPSM|nr:unnamed protein product [Lepeophtheirus salmonis]CAF2792600.1 unnamed protein product [Lepeophtheirus salmonis]